MTKLFEKLGQLFGVAKEKNIWLGICIPYIVFLLYNAIIISVIYAISRSLFAGFVFGFFADMAVLAILIWRAKEIEQIFRGIDKIAEGQIDYKLEVSRFHFDNVKRAEQVNRIGDGIQMAVERSMKDERMKADLITNVSHDIKTPLTSIINYVDLLGRADIQDETIRGYINVLAEKSERLKQLTIDLVEASKISSGNIAVNLEQINITDLCKQALGEYTDKLTARNLTVVTSFPNEAVTVSADPRHMWRIVDNLLGNICKYALPGTRVYLDVIDGEKKTVVFKNISECELNFAAEELTERFIRGDLSRTTEGSGLGLSIAKNLTTLQGGEFQIDLDGDLFKVTIAF